MVQTYYELIDRLPEIRDRGYIRTHRAGNTGIGKTLEDLLDIDENNFTGPNGHQTELKSSRKGTQSMMTLFTKSPLPAGINTKLVEKFGRPKGAKKVLHTTVRADKENTLHGGPGFIAKVTDTQIRLTHPNSGNMDIPYWEKDKLEKAFLRKYPKNLLYVKAEHRGRGVNEEFKYDSAWLMSGFSFDNFVDLLKKGIILIDIRIGQYRDGRTHDHGTGFRVKQDNLDLCFSNRERVL